MHDSRGCGGRGVQDPGFEVGDGTGTTAVGPDPPSPITTPPSSTASRVDSARQRPVRNSFETREDRSAASGLDPDVRTLVRALLQRKEEVEVIAEAGDGREARAVAEQHRPDVPVTDIAMPRVSVLEPAARVARELHAIRAITLRMHAGEEYAGRAHQSGTADAPSRVGIASDLLHKINSMIYWGDRAGRALRKDC